MNNISLSEIIAARNKCAQIVALYGTKYLPIFERIEGEVEQMLKQQKLLDRALDIAHKNSTQNDTFISTHFKAGKSYLVKKFNKFSCLGKK